MAKRYVVSGWKWTGNVDLKKGSLVKIFGLQSKPEWNDKIGIIMGDLDMDTMRYPVMLKDNIGERGLLKITNVMGVKLELRKFAKLRHANIHAIASYSYHIDGTACGYCGRKEEFVNLKSCGGCKGVGTRREYIIKYCNKQCQKRHWKIHKSVCGKLFSSR